MAKVDFEELLKDVDLNELLEFDSVKKLVQAQSDRRVTQALATAKTKWQEEEAQKKTEAEKLEQMSEEQKKVYQFEQDKKAFEQERAKFQHDQLVVETQKQLISAGLPDLAAYVTGATAEETTANLANVSKVLADWKTEQLNRAMRGQAPKDMNPQDTGTKLTRAELEKMSPEEINAAWAAGKIDTSTL